MTLHLSGTPILDVLLSSTMEPSQSFLQRQYSQKKAAVTLLIPPKLLGRARSFTNGLRPETPLSSAPPSLPHSPTTSSQSSHSTVTSRSNFHQIVPLISPYLGACDLLNMMSVSPTCRNRLGWKAFESHLRGNSWDFDALARRVQPRKDHKSRLWLSLAKSAVQKERILPLYDQIPKQTSIELPTLEKKTKHFVEKLLRVLLDIVTEHDNRNFMKLESLARSGSLSFIQFVSKIPAYNWKLRYIKTFIVAAYVHGQTSYVGNDDDLCALAQTLNFDDDESPIISATHVNFIYIFGCFAVNKIPRYPITSFDYDSPFLTLSHGLKLPGVRQAVDRFKTTRLKLEGFYRKASGEISPMKMDVEPQGLSSKSNLPFLDRNLITMNASVSDGNSSWNMEGSVDQDNGTGTLKSRVTYKLSVTPWGVVGEKLQTDHGKHLGYFVLHWS